MADCDGGVMKHKSEWRSSHKASKEQGDVLICRMALDMTLWKARMARPCRNSFLVVFYCTLPRLLIEDLTDRRVLIGSRNVKVPV